MVWWFGGIMQDNLAYVTVCGQRVQRVQWVVVGVARGQQTNQLRAL